MKKKKVIKTLVVMTLSSLTLAINVQALTSTTSSHSYGSSYSTNIQKGEEYSGELYLNEDNELKIRYRK